MTSIYFQIWSSNVRFFLDKKTWENIIVQLSRYYKCQEDRGYDFKQIMLLFK